MEEEKRQQTTLEEQFDKMSLEQSKEPSQGESSQKIINKKVLFLGFDGAGKTTTFRLLSSQGIDDIVPTTGFNITKVSHDNFALNVFDIGGGKNIRPYWVHYVHDIDALVYFVDGTKPELFSESKIALFEVVNDENFSKKAPIVILSNKSDETGFTPCEKLEESFELSKIENHPWKAFSNSITTIATSEIPEWVKWLESQWKAKK